MAVFPIPEEAEQNWQGWRDAITRALGYLQPAGSVTPELPGTQRPQSLTEMMAGLMIPGTMGEALGSGAMGMGQMPLQIKIPKSLQGLAAEAKKYKSFNEFENAFLGDIKHGTYWHWTDNPNFIIDPNKGPLDMSSMAIGNKPDLGKLMITSHLENWADYGVGGKGRPYAALIDMSEVPANKYWQVRRGFGNELFVDDPSLAKVLKIYPRERAFRVARERHAALPQSQEALKEFYEKVWEMIKENK